MHYNISDKVSFQAGLTPAIRKELNHINTKETERIIEKQFNTDCNFHDNRTLALGTYYALNLLKEASEKFGLPFRATPPSLRVYKPTELIKQEDVNFGFCTAQLQKVMKKQPLFAPRSVFIKNVPDNIDKFNNRIEKWYEKRITSSDNFIAPFLHEILHNIHLKRIFDGHTQFGLLDAILMGNTSFSHQQNKIISDKIGSYAKTSQMELYAEAFAKMITDSLDSTGTKLASNPLDKLKDFPLFVQDFLKSQIG